MEMAIIVSGCSAASAAISTAAKTGKLNEKHKNLLQSCCTVVGLGIMIGLQIF